jgi:hypothetical protein
VHNRRCAPPVRPLPARSSSCALACWSDTWWRLCGSRRMLAAPTSSTYSCAWRAERNAQRVGPTQRRARAVGFKVDSYPSGGVESCPWRFRRRTNPDRPPRWCTQVSQAISGIWWIFRGRHYQPKWRPRSPNNDRGATSAGPGSHFWRVGSTNKGATAADLNLPTCRATLRCPQNM